MTQAFKHDPYADVGEVIAEETAYARVRARPTPKTPTDNDDRDDSSSTLRAPELGPVFGFHIDGDKRYQER